MSLVQSDGGTIAGLIDQAAARLGGVGIANPRLDARLLLAHIIGIDQAGLISQSREPVAGECRDRFAELIERRAGREPVSRILGEREFYGRGFTVAPAVLDPRPDSEILIEAALQFAEGRADRPLGICDFGTGSGALIVTLLAELPDCIGLGIDIDADAAALARANARRHGVERRCGFCVGDWDRPIDGAFDLIVSNPPYIDRHAIEGLEPEVRDHDPVLALDGGEDGLDGHRAIAAAADRLLAPGHGVVMVEIGADQGCAVTDLFARHGLCRRELRTDLAGRDRVFVAGKA